MAMALALSGCLQDPNAAEGGGLGGQAYAPGGSADGDGTVTMMGVVGGPEQAALEKSLEKFEEESGIDIEYTSDKDLPTTILQKANAGDTPDIALFPQPGGLLALANDGHIQPIDTYLDYDELDKTLVPGFLDAARLNGRVYGAPVKMAVKSLVFYPKKAYEEAGYNTAPETLEELRDVADKIEADGASAWCMGWNDAQATGWVGTDWIEEYVLRLHGPEVYDEWVDHDIPFDDERIVEAFEAFKTNVIDHTYGGKKAILNTAFGESVTPEFDNPPKCYLHRQGDFITSFMPQKIQDSVEEEVGIFAFPTAEDGFQGQPILGGGDMAALFNGNDDEAIEVMRYITSDEFGEEWAKSGGWLSPHRTFDPENYSSPIAKQVAQIVSEADVFRFDGSDLMPKEIGSDAFWDGMIDFANGASGAEVTGKIEEAWPEE